MVRRFDTGQHTTPFLRALDTLRREASRQVEHPEAFSRPGLDTNR